MLPFSENNQNIKISPEHFAIGFVHNDNLPLGNIALQCHSKQLQEDLMVFSDDFLHFLKIKIFFLLNSPKLSCGFKPVPDFPFKRERIVILFFFPVGYFVI